jgi:NTP pyrophosphatase (non-canonical NTP hydrolase)
VVSSRGFPLLCRSPLIEAVLASRVSRSTAYSTNGRDASLKCSIPYVTKQFHSPKNLGIALSVEVAESVERFQWLTEEQNKNLTLEKVAEVREEIGDVMIYLTELADELGWTCVGSLDCFRLRAVRGDESIATNKPYLPTGVSPRTYPAS